MHESVSCVECSVAMEEGFFADRGDHARIVPSIWVKGAPEAAFFSGTKVRGKERRAVQVFRCPRCGLLKLYGHEEA